MARAGHRSRVARPELPARPVRRRAKVNLNAHLYSNGPGQIGTKAAERPSSEVCAPLRPKIVRPKRDPIEQYPNNTST
ncbi:hypothetical protein FAIPA1_490021 [Frankia sp. AiPs1]